MITIPGAIPITIHPIFWVITFALGWLSSGQDIVYTCMWVVVATISILVHEFGHALTAKAFGQRVHVELVGMGGLTHHRGGRLNSFKEFLIVLNGPLAGFFLFIICSTLLVFYGKQMPLALVQMLHIGVWINFYWTILNIMPVYPMDGGQLTRIILEAIFGTKGIKLSLLISMAVGGLLAVYFLWSQSIYIAGIFLLFVYESYKAWSTAFEMTESDQKADFQEELRDAYREKQYGDIETAKLKLLGIRERTQTGLIFYTATEYLAEILNEQGSVDEVYELLQPVQKHLHPEGLMILQEAAYRKGNLKESVELGNKIYQQHPQYHTAILNALTHASLGDVRSCVGWLHCAEREGITDIGEVLQKPEFDQVRNDPYFRENFSCG